jgi:hypothetical protein
MIHDHALMIHMVNPRQVHIHVKQTQYQHLHLDGVSLYTSYQHVTQQNFINILCFNIEFKLLFKT